MGSSQEIWFRGLSVPLPRTVLEPQWFPPLLASQGHCEAPASQEAHKRSPSMTSWSASSGGRLAEWGRGTAHWLLCSGFYTDVRDLGID